MKLTNKLNLPEPIVRAIANDPYSGDKASDFTATGLLKPARAQQLIKDNRDKIEQDVSEMIFALCGQVGHSILERAADKNIVERRFYAKIATFTVSGQADLIITDWIPRGPNKAELIDYKFCSVWSVLDGVKPEWTAQANILRYLASEDENPVQITKANIIAIFRDWSKPKAAREKDYPQTQLQVLHVTLWPLEQTEKFICERIAANLAAEKELPLCTDEERWHTPDKWAVLKKGAKRANRLYDSENEAHQAARAQNMVIEFRPGISKRCESYCLAAPFCEQFKT